jgi:hypothetical protein
MSLHANEQRHQSASEPLSKVLSSTARRVDRGPGQDECTETASAAFQAGNNYTMPPDFVSPYTAEGLPQAADMAVSTSQHGNDYTTCHAELSGI